MSVTSRNDLKSNFETGDIPSGADYANIFDSFVHKQEDGITITDDTGQKTVGIGTQNPAQVLHVAGGSSGDGNVGITIENREAILNHGWSLVHTHTNNITNGQDDGKFSLVSLNPIGAGGNREYITVKTDGSVGIGVNDPLQALEVNGAIKIGTAADSAQDGTVRYVNSQHGYDVEAKIDGAWVSLTAVNDGGATEVSAINGHTGDVHLYTDDIPEIPGANNLYFTNTRALNASFTSYGSDAGTIGVGDTIKTAIQKLDGNKVNGTLDSTTTGQIAFSSGTNNSVAGNSNFTYSSGTLHVGRTTSGSAFTASNNSAGTGGASALYINDGYGGLGIGYSDSQMHIRATASQGIIMAGGGYYGVYSNSPMVVNGSLSVNYNDVATASLDVGSSTTGKAALRLRKGVTTVNPNEGDVWFDNSGLNARINGHDVKVSAWIKTNDDNGIYLPGGYVGVGTSAPRQMLDITGAIIIGDTDGAITIPDGTIRYSNQSTGGLSYDLEVRADGEWKSLTASNNPPVSSVNTKTGNVSLTTDDISDAGADNKYFSNALAIGAKLSGFNASASAGTLIYTDTVLQAIEKLNANDGTKVSGNIPSTAGLIPISNGTSNTIATSGNLTYTSNNFGGYMSIGALYAGSDRSNEVWLQGQSQKFSLLAASSATRIDLNSDGTILLGGDTDIAGKLYVGGAASPTAVLDIEPGTATTPGIRLRPGAELISPADGAIWYNGSALQVQLSSQAFNLTVWESVSGGVNYSGGKIGINIASPIEKLEVNGAIRIGEASGDGANNGTIRYSNAHGQYDVEAKIGGTWKSLTGVTRVNGSSGDVTLNTGNISEGTNYYFTNDRAIGSTLTGYSTPSNGVVVYTDTISGALLKLDTAVAAKVSSQWTTSGSNIYYNSGNVGVRVTSPLAVMDIAASQGTAPSLRINPGTAPSGTAPDGSIWYNGSNLVGNLGGRTTQLGPQFSGTSITVKPSSGNSFTVLNSSDVPQVYIDSSNQFAFYTGGAGPIYFGAFGSPQYGRAGFSVPNNVIMGLSASSMRFGFGGGGTYFVTNDPSSLVDVKGKADEVQMIVSANSSQTNNIVQVMASNRTTNYFIVSPSGKVGIGVASPTEKLEVGGAIVVGNAAGSAAGTIYYDGTTFKGITGSGAVSLTGVTMVNGSTGDITLTTANISESGGNYYFTNDKSMAAILVDPSNNASSYTPSAGTVAKSDTMYNVVRKLDGNINSKVSSQWTTSGSNIYYNTGNIGLGTSSPSQKIHASGSTDAGFIGLGLQNTRSAVNTQWNIGHYSNVGTNYDGNLSFYELISGSNNERVTFKAGGKVGIGVTNPTERLEINGAIVVGNAVGSAVGTLYYDTVEDSFKGITAVGHINFGGGGEGAVSSVNGQTGEVALTTADVSEAGTYYYFTNSRAIGATLSGYSTPSGGVVTSTDSISGAVLKLDTAITSKVSSQWTSSSGNIYFSGGNVGIGSTSVYLSKTTVDDPFIGGHFDGISVVNSRGDTIKLYETPALTAENVDVVGFDPSICDIVSNMRTRIYELEERLKALGFISVD